MENIIYPENQIAGAGTSGKVTSYNLIVILLLINNKFKSIFFGSGFYKIFFLLIMILLLPSLKPQAQRNVNYALYANIIYRFTKYIKWPDDKKTGDFIIGIVGDSPLYNKIKSFTINKATGTHKIVIKTFSNSPASSDCQKP